MKICEIIEERWDDVERQFENPVPHDPDKMEDAFEFMDEIDGTLSELYKQEHNMNKFSSADEYAKAIVEQRNKYGEIKDIPIDAVLATETHLHKDHIDSILKGSVAKSSSGLPILYKMGNVFFVGDGNHRVAAEKIRGSKTVKALVLDGDKILKQ
jgi:hypothetical protein